MSAVEIPHYDLARKLVDHPRWRWVEGMRAMSPGRKSLPDRVVDVDPDGSPEVWCDGYHTRAHGEGHRWPWRAVPDLSDWATIGAMMGMFAGYSPLVSAQGPAADAGKFLGRLLLREWRQLDKVTP